MSAPLDKGQPGRLLIDDFLPRYDLTQVQHVLVAASPTTTYQVLRRVDVMESRLARALVWSQAVPKQLMRRARGLPTRVVAPAHAGFDDMLATKAWTLLAEEPGQELVLGLLWPFGQAVPQIPEVDPAGWAAFADPGFAKVAWSMSVRPFGAGRTLVVSEARTACTDAATARHFRLIWRGLGPFAALLKGRLLHLVVAGAAR